jgi:hypothetical protein
LVVIAGAGRRSMLMLIEPVKLVMACIVPIRKSTSLGGIYPHNLCTIRV